MTGCGPLATLAPVQLLSLLTGCWRCLDPPPGPTARAHLCAASSDKPSLTRTQLDQALPSICPSQTPTSLCICHHLLTMKATG